MAEPMFSDRVLEETPTRTTKFLTGLGAAARLRTILSSAGLTSADVDEGIKMLIACLVSPSKLIIMQDTDEAQLQRKAVSELDQSDEVIFACSNAALRRHFPEVRDYIFHDLQPSRGTLAVEGWAKLLGRLDALENGTDPTREKSRDSDREAVKLLDGRGLDPDSRKRYAALVKTALGPTPPLVDDEIIAKEREDRRVKLTELKLWYEEWSTTARAVVKKRADLIKLGLAARRSPDSAEDTGEEDTGEEEEGAAPAQGAEEAK